MLSELSTYENSLASKDFLLFSFCRSIFIGGRFAAGSSHRVYVFGDCFIAVSSAKIS